MENTVTVETRNVETTRRAPSTYSAAGRSRRLGGLAIGIAIVAAFISTIAFSLDHAVPSLRLHQHIFSQYNLIGAILIIIGLTFAYFHPEHKWIYYAILGTSIVFVFLSIANFIFHMCLLDQADVDNVTVSAEQKSIIKLVKAGAAFTFVDGVFKFLIAAVCLMIAATKF